MYPCTLGFRLELAAAAFTTVGLAASPVRYHDNRLVQRKAQEKNCMQFYLPVSSFGFAFLIQGFFGGGGAGPFDDDSVFVSPSLPSFGHVSLSTSLGLSTSSTAPVTLSGFSEALSSTNSELVLGPLSTSVIIPIFPTNVRGYRITTNTPSQGTFSRPTKLNTPRDDSQVIQFASAKVLVAFQRPIVENYPVLSPFLYCKAMWLTRGTDRVNWACVVPEIRRRRA